MTQPLSYRSSDEAGRESPRLGLVLPPSVPSHTVQFYENEDYLASAVTDFVAAGLAIGEESHVALTAAQRHVEILAREQDRALAEIGGDAVVADLEPA